MDNEKEQTCSEQRVLLAKQRRIHERDLMFLVMEGAVDRAINCARNLHSIHVREQELNLQAAKDRRDSFNNNVRKINV